MTSRDKIASPPERVGIDAERHPQAESPPGAAAQHVSQAHAASPASAAAGATPDSVAADSPAGAAAYEYLLVIGPGRSGSEFLYRNLRLHPMFSIPEIKEGHYYRSLSRYRKALAKCRDTILADVANHARCDPGLEAGIERIHGSGDRVLVVLLLRHHRDRAASIVRFRRSRGYLSALGSIRQLQKSVMADMLTLRELRAAFDIEVDIMTIDFEALTSDPQAVLCELSRVCGVRASLEIVTDKVNQSVKARFRPFAALGLALAKALRRLGVRRPLQRLKDSAWIHRAFWVPGTEEVEFSDEDLRTLDRLWYECSAYISEHTVEIAPGIRFRKRQH